MSTRISPIAAQLGRLSISSAATRTSIRLAHSKTATATTTSSTPTAKKPKRRKGGRIEPSFEPGHGEKIFIFNHILDGMTVYSHSPVLKANHAFRQIPFNGKKLRPAKLRKDYWRPLAMIQFPDGGGEVGRSVFQRLRECKRLHEYAWGDHVLYGPRGETLTTRQRGRRLNDQRANTIADMAAVLGGLGKGNKIVVAGDGGGDGLAPVVTGDGKALVPATVWWSDALDRNYATKWPENVTHELFEEASLEPVTPAVAGEAEPVGEESASPAQTSTPTNAP
ncbi:hypothetical protein SAMD00023353_3501040 [Rosellinia necatrix]|uniref:Large ribosomal subunit protein mL67 n=1 Tax=Rosellinia necatrix TaxID=77044 RepID=A0A1W2TMW0_ROSNE|nr:hypothetical protein SAMD00023353_3501040 [Rosellinia necatrix]